MSLTVYDNLSAYFPARVRLTAIEKGLDIKFVHVDIVNGESLKPDFMRINPNSTVPVLTDGAFKLLQSKEIMEYLNGFDGKPLGASVPKAQVEKWVGLIADWDGNLYVRFKSPEEVVEMQRKISKFRIGFAEARRKENPDLDAVYDAKIKDMQHKDDPTLESMKACELQLFDILDQCEQALTNDFLAGKEFTIADVVLICLLYRVNIAGQLHLLLEKRPRLDQYYQRMQERPSFQKTFHSTFVQRNPVFNVLPTLFKAQLAQWTGRY
ncbi:hypothetical protein EDD86DRAFT_66934 [Gorgonomyces haynaldii]|nr:hypothetical protein EDD86DRAFT_66934 [Gorgonomyces haynaldii]